MRWRSGAWLLPIGLALSCCGCGAGGETQPSVAAPAERILGYAGLPDRDSPGAQVLLRSGCLACHRVGASGNHGPGPSLTRVGARLDARSIARVLIDPRPPMPSFRRLPPAQRRALVAYLADRR
jgi:menaquinol-cytochrome c reductase cytochrome b/c subunit